MAYENLLLEVKDQIARITFNRPNVLNALNRRTMEEFGEILSVVRADAAVRVVISPAPMPLAASSTRRQ